MLSYKSSRCRFPLISRHEFDAPEAEFISVRRYATSSDKTDSNHANYCSHETVHLRSPYLELGHRL